MRQAVTQAKQHPSLPATAGTGHSLHPGTRRANDTIDVLTTVFVQSEEALSDEQLTAFGARRYAQLGDIAIITLPLSRVEELSELREVHRIEASQLCRPTMDTVPRNINLLPVYEHTAQHQAFTGSGVVVGVMDIGFDLTHPNFYNDTSLSHYRIKALWDQLAPSSDRSRLPVGADFTTAEALLAQGCTTDGRTMNHGTHTTGIAAGSGYDSPYRGVAYESDIVLVANAVTSDTIYIQPDDHFLYTSATDALGFKYLFDYAKSQGMPCVVSFSEGYIPNMDEDDRLFSLFIERLTGPGRIFVASAGNERQVLTYVGKPAGMEEAGAFLLSWHKTASYRLQTDGDAKLTLQVYDNNGGMNGAVDFALNSRHADTPQVDTLFIGQDTCAVSLSCYASAFESGKTVGQLVLTANKDISSLAPIALVTTGIGSHTEVFGSSSAAFSNATADTRWSHAEASHNVLAPGCFDSAITVGSTTHRMSLDMADGRVIKDSHTGDEGRVSWFSSAGPTIDGRLKPDVTAPGNYVVSSLSSYYHEQQPQENYWDVSYFDAGGRIYVWGGNLGTSMSCPVVAGTIALWLEAKPDLTPQEVRDVLRRTCRQPDNSLDYPNTLYGYGEIDAHRGLLNILGLDGIKNISLHQPHSVSVYADKGLLHLRFDNVPQHVVTVSLYSTAGTLCYRQQLTASATDATIVLPTLGAGIYAVQLTAKDAGVTGSQLVRIQ